MLLAARALDGFLKPLALWRGLALEWRRAIAGFIVYMLALAALAWPSVVSMAHQWISSSSFHHAPLAAPLALWLILRRPDLAVQPRPFPPALAAIALLACLWAIGRAIGANIAEHLTLVGLLIAGAAFFFGAANARAWAFPLAFLFFLVPFGATLLPFLQQAAAVVSATLLTLAGLDTAQNGVMLTTGAGSFEIAESCAGLNFLLAAMMASSLFANIALHDWRRRAGFIALAFLLAIAANIFRIVFVIAAATLTGSAYSIGADHIVFGWAFYAVMLFALMLVGRRLAAAERASSTPGD